MDCGQTIVNNDLVRESSLSFFQIHKWVILFSEGIPFLVMATNSDRVPANESAIISDVTRELNLQQLLAVRHDYSVVPVNLSSNERSVNEETITHFLTPRHAKEKRSCEII